MYSRVNYTIVGLFVLLFGIGTVLFFFWLAKYGLQQEYDVYKVYMRESVSGLSKDSVVKLHGVDVGRVKEIRIDPKDIERVEILLNIKHGTPIKEDMVAHTTMLGVTGLLAIEIEGGTNAAKTLKPSKDHIPVIKSTSSWFDTTKNNIGTLADRLAELVEQANKLLSENNIENFGKILEHTEKFTAMTPGLIREANATLVQYKTAVKDLTRNMDSITRSFNGVSEVAVPAVKKFTETARNFNRVTLKVERTLDRGDYNLQKMLEPMLIDIEILSKQLNDLTRELKQSPSDLLFKSRRTRKGPGE